MITGSVNADLEGAVRLLLHGPAGQVQEVQALMDTGFNGFLTLPPTLIAALGLPRIGRGRAVLANGQLELFEIHEARVVWDGQLRTVEADGADTDVLMGMSLIYGYELRMQAVDGGNVNIEALA